MCQQTGDDVADVEGGGEQKDLLDAAVGSLDDEHPYDHRRDRHDDVSRHSKQLETACDAGEIGHDVAEVRDDQRQHQEERHAEAEFLPDQIAQAFPRRGPHACRHLLHDDQRGRDRNHGPQERVPELCSRQRIREDAARVVVDVSCDEPRADHRKRDRQTRSPTAVAEDGFSSDIDYTMLIKLYGAEPPLEARYSRYSRVCAKFVGEKRSQISRRSVAPRIPPSDR